MHRTRAWPHFAGTPPPAGIIVAAIAARPRTSRGCGQRSRGRSGRQTVWCRNDPSPSTARIACHGSIGGAGPTAGGCPPLRFTTDRAGRLPASFSPPARAGLQFASLPGSATGAGPSTRSGPGNRRHLGAALFDIVNRPRRGRASPRPAREHRRLRPPASRTPRSFRPRLGAARPPGPCRSPSRLRGPAARRSAD
jgi:hypothetical protein